MYSTNITTTRPTTAAEISTFKRQVAGWGLIVPYCGIFAVYIVCLLSMLKLRKQYPLFGFLISFSCADLGIIVLAIYVGFGIMLQANPLGDVVTFSWLNFFWNPMIFHYSIVAVSRFMGIIYYQKVVVWFPVRNICIICGICWTIGIGIQVWFNFLPSSYYVFRADKLGFIYVGDGSLKWINTFWLYFSNTAVVGPIAIYAVLFLKISCFDQTDPASEAARRTRVELKISLGCLFNSLCLLVQNYANNFLNFSALGEWLTYFATHMLFANSFLSPLLLFATSDTLRRQAAKILRGDKTIGSTVTNKVIASKVTQVSVEEI